MVGKTDWDLKVEFHDLDKTATDTKTKLHNSTVCTMLWTGGMQLNADLDDLCIIIGSLS